ncbi:hypothetical protein KGF54_002483 [Candida jiufengensis]|uniref:uncharacterized protein n=1 Tax=Candida jiufengensis TaxID=497108 RepID=UPI0022258EC2|nr:uncharacterized protein KGF54_002483 [Candida jiufengensis]KAI5953112.1 hypothetical protein KGF54_002483 [Candida jiufengensis]
MTDWGPGENHIVLQNKHKQFYRPEVFGEAETYNKSVPLFINDIRNSIDLFKTYKHVSFQMSDTLMINNWPINQAEIFGRIIGEKYQPEKDFATLTIDDYSGSRSIFVIRMTYDNILESNIKIFEENYGKLIRMVGHFHNNQFKVDNLNIINNNDMEIEFGFWSERVEFRETILRNAWKFEPIAKSQKVQEEIVFKFSQRELQRREEREKLNLTSDDMVMTSNIEDSLVVHENKANEIIVDLTDSPELKAEPEVIVISDDEDEEYQFKLKMTNIIKKCLVVIIENSFEVTTLKELTENESVSKLIQPLSQKSLIMKRIGVYFSKSDLFSVEGNIINSFKFDQIYHNIKKYLNEKTNFNVVKYVNHIKLNFNVNVEYKLINYLINYILINTNKNWIYLNDEKKFIKQTNLD